MGPDPGQSPAGEVLKASIVSGSIVSLKGAYLVFPKHCAINLYVS